MSETSGSPPRKKIAVGKPTGEKQSAPAPHAKAWSADRDPASKKANVLDEHLVVQPVAVHPAAHLTRHDSEFTLLVTHCRICCQPARWSQKSWCTGLDRM